MSKRQVTITSLLRRMQSYDEKIWDVQAQILDQLGLTATDHNLSVVAELAFQDPPATQQEIDEFVARQKRISHKE